MKQSYPFIFFNKTIIWFYILGIRDSLKHIKKLKYLKCSNYSQSITASQIHSEFMLSMLKENTQLKTFWLESFHTRFDWIPIDYELGLKEV